MPPPLIIEFSGRKGSGKDSCAEELCRRLQSADDAYVYRQNQHPVVLRFAFGGYLKQVCTSLFGLSYTQCWGTQQDKDTPTGLLWERFPIPDQEKPRHEGPMTAREVLQYFGTNVIRQIDPDAWVRQLLRRTIPGSRPDIALITDARFPNEVDAVLEAGGKVIRLTRTPSPEDQALSEIALEPDVYDWSRFSAVIDNAHLTLQETHDEVWRVTAPWVAEYFASQEKA